MKKVPKWSSLIDSSRFWYISQLQNCRKGENCKASHLRRAWLVVKVNQTNFAFFAFPALLEMKKVPKWSSLIDSSRFWYISQLQNCRKCEKTQNRLLSSSGDDFQLLNFFAFPALLEMKKVPKWSSLIDSSRFWYISQLQNCRKCEKTQNRLLSSSGDDFQLLNFFAFPALLEMKKVPKWSSLIDSSRF